MATVIISKLPPPPDGTGSGAPKGTDLIPATDTTDTTEASSGTTKKYTLANQFYFMMTALGYSTTAACRVATTANLTANYDNGLAGVGATLTNSGAKSALTIDGVAVAIGDRILVWTQVTATQNGIYVVSNAGSTLVNWVLTRATDYDTGSDVIEDGLVLVNQGGTYAGVCFQEVAAGPFTIGSSDISFAPFSFDNTDFIWHNVTTSNQQMKVNAGYVANKGTLVTLALPVTSAFGDQIAIVGRDVGGWKISQGPLQQIIVGSVSSTPGNTGYVASGNQRDSISLVCTLANLEWTAFGGPQGQLTII